MGVRKAALFSIKAFPFEKIDVPQKISEYFGENTFSLKVSGQLLSDSTYKAFLNWIRNGVTISPAQADEIALVMKDWAVSKGATHYTHWFQPLTGLTAEKHDSFADIAKGGTVIEQFGGSNLIQGEPDASSFPSGGIRATFEARGYTAWDPSSPAFILETELSKTLCIPSIFISYHGAALDKKLPLLRSDEALNKAALKLFEVFGNKAEKVFSTCGAEQEFFLIDEKFYKMRQDLLLSGRTITGAPSPKGQQLEDQYFGSIKQRVLNYMADVGFQAARLGIPLKTRHNEVAPSQFEFAPVFEESNIAADHNLLLMDVLKRTANRHGLVCLLHEKPFAGVNGSGKHLNWSMSDDKGNNLLDPGQTPQENLFFLTVLVAVLRAVHLHADLLRASVASAGNELRLGANEAPPAIISVFLGDYLSDILDTLEQGKKKEFSNSDIMDLGLGRLPTFTKHNTDRNRTSPFAFTGSKFEFRAIGSSQNISTPIMVVNTIIAESLEFVADKIANYKTKMDFDSAVMKVVKELIKQTKPIRFDGDNYSKHWLSEAKKRSLQNEPATANALKSWISDENIKLFSELGVLSEDELSARYIAWLQGYNMSLEIEANTLFEMVDAGIVPVGYKYEQLLAENLRTLLDLEKTAGLKLDADAVKDHKTHLVEIVSKIYQVRRHLIQMKELVSESKPLPDMEKAMLFFNKLRPLMELIRKHVDQLEQVVPDDQWLIPKYREMLFIS